MTADPVALRALYVHGRTGNLWLEDSVIVLQQDGVRRRIPLAAVAEVRNGGRRVPSVEIILRAGEGSGHARYELQSRSDVTVRLFVETVTAALSAAHAAHPVDDGAELVVEEPDPQARQRTETERRQGRRLSIGLVTCLALWVVGLVIVTVAGEPDSLTFWLAGTTPLLIGALATLGAVFSVRGWVVRRRRGIGVVAVFERHEGRHRIFVFTDNAGERQEYQGNSTTRTFAEDPPRIQLIHDPLGRVSAQPHESLVGMVAKSIFYLIVIVPFLAVGLYALPYQLIRALLIGG